MSELLEEIDGNCWEMKMCYSMKNTEKNKLPCATSANSKTMTSVNVFSKNRK